MLSAWDDYPLHQTSYPVAHPVSSDAGRYDRYWMTMLDRDLTTQLGFGLCVYPNRGLIDAAISVSRGGRQQSVYASGPLTRDRETRVGPLRVEVVEPMRVLRVVCEDYGGMSADLTFTGDTQVVEDGHMVRMSGPVLISERTRTVQFGHWEGVFSAGGQQTRCLPGSWLGLRDRSWGSRTTGTVAESSMAAAQSQIYFAWTLLRFEHECLLAAVNETPDGRREARTVAVLPVIGRHDPACGDDGTIRRGDEFGFDIGYVPRTRRPAHVHLRIGPRGAIDDTVDIEPRHLFQMKGLGYSHPRWRHGADHGGEVAGADAWDLADLDPVARENVHVQQLCRAVRGDGQVGLGLFEHVAIGPHAPTGLPDGLAPR
jgi:hypothetical protein